MSVLTTLTGPASAFGAESHNFNGFHFGMGINVTSDKYDADVTIGQTIDHKIINVANTANTAKVDVSGTDAGKLINGLLKYDGNSVLISDLKVNNTTVLKGKYEQLTPIKSESDTSELNLYSIDEVNTFTQLTNDDFLECNVTAFELEQYNNPIFSIKDPNDNNPQQVQSDIYYRSSVNPIDETYITHTINGTKYSPIDLYINGKKITPYSSSDWNSRVCRQTCLLHIIANTRLSIA